MKRGHKLLLALAAIYLIWGGSFAVTSVGVHNLPPFLFGGLRFVIAGAVLVGIAVALGHRPRFDRTEFQHVVAVGFAGVVLSNGANTWGMQWMASNQAALLNATGALWIALLSCFGPRAHPLDRWTALGLLLGFVGVVLVLGGSHPAATPAGWLPWIPEIVMLIGVLAWSGATVYQRSFLTRLDLLTFTGSQMLIGGAILIGLGLATGEGPRWHWGGPGIVAFGYMVLMSSIVAYTAYGWLARNATPAVVGSYSYINPAIAALLGWLLLDEHLGATKILGMLVMLAGVALASWPRNPRAGATTASEGHGA